MSLYIPAATIIAVTFAYIALRWRKSPKVFKAMNIVAAASIVAGLLTGVWLVGLMREALPYHGPTGGGVSGGADGSAGAASSGRSARIAPDLRGQIGVFVDASNGITEVRCYGSQEVEPFNLEDVFHFTFSHADCVPQVNDLQEFLINLPGADITDSQVFALPDLHATWHISGSANDPQPLQATIKMSGNVFRIDSPELRAAHQGFIALVVKMPLGTPGRMYAVEVGR